MTPIQDDLAPEDLEGWPPRQLLVECAMCRRSFHTGLAADQRPSDATDQWGRIHECPFCGFTTAYRNMDYRYEGE